MKQTSPAPSGPAFSQLEHAIAITMWDFSWLERRWPGAGYEDWDLALDELAERGYEAVRIDCYPHLVAENPTAEWQILPPWNQQDWGSPAPVKVRVMPALIEFIQKCKERGLRVGLSSWYQDDSTSQRLSIASPSALSDCWSATLEHIKEAGLMDTILFADLCNEWGLSIWTPFFCTAKTGTRDWRSEESLWWMESSIRQLRATSGELPLTFSLAHNLDKEHLEGMEVPFMDFLELHRCMAGCTEFYERVGYNFERYDSSGYDNVVKYAEKLYRSDPEYWWNRFTPHLDAMVEFSRQNDRLLGTSEGWSIVDYKDWPGLDWGWVKEFNERAVDYVLESGRWAMVCTSNFCGPQFHGMWRDIAWHQRLTDKIRRARLA